LPIGIQLAAGAFQEGKLLRVAQALETAIGFNARPSLEAGKMAANRA
jgi:Asp-tRNA(Asn)/Glu-tRNA(Gln) amidotransferase A subunit family amidase